MFRDVFADIGDEQSIAQSLSTFSGHLRSIIRIVEHAGPGTLVLLDELGAGTDPTEGSALAQALLDHFIRSGALVAATTHYAEIKVYAHETPAARNALGRVRPRDALADLPAHDRPAGRQPGVRDRRAPRACRRRSSPTPGAGSPRTSRRSRRRSRRIRQQEGEIAEAVERARVAEAKAAEALRAADEERRRARRERDEAVRAARDEAERLVEGAARRRRRRPPPPRARDGDRAGDRRRPGARGADPRPAARRRRPEGAPAPVGRAADVAAGRPGAEPERAAGRAGSRRSRRAAPARRSRRAACASRSRSTTSSRPWACAGRRRRRGTGSGAGGGERRRLAGHGRPGSGPCSSSGRGRSRRRWTCAAPGWTRRSRRWRRYLDDASLAGLEQVVIIHGLGTGALRDAVRAQAGAHPLVKSFRAGERGEGGDGATIVRL